MAGELVGQEIASSQHCKPRVHSTRVCSDDMSEDPGTPQKSGYLWSACGDLWSPLRICFTITDLSSSRSHERIPPDCHVYHIFSMWTSSYLWPEQGNTITPAAHSAKMWAQALIRGNIILMESGYDSLCRNMCMIELLEAISLDSGWSSLCTCIQGDTKKGFD